MANKSVGELEEIVMRAILHLGNDAYGVEIRDAIEKIAHRPLSYGAIYATLERLSNKGWVAGRAGEVTSERGGKAKRYFRVSGEGVDVLRRTESVRAAFQTGLLRTFGGAS